MAGLKPYKKGGRDMKRTITYNYDEKTMAYSLYENEAVVFSIDKNNLKFDSLKFYQNIYKDKSINIELKDEMEKRHSSDKEIMRKGKYIFEWLDKIVKDINEKMGTVDDQGIDKIDEEISVKNKQTIHLFDLSACAGDGFYADGSENNWEDFETENENADYAVKISGKSMESEIPDGSIVLVKEVINLENNDIGIFWVDQKMMCKRYINDEEKEKLVPDNPEYDAIDIKEDTECRVQGKVIDILPSS